MSTKITLFVIISLILVIPSASAQGINIGEKAVQKSVEVVINDDNEIHVKHVVSSSDSPKQMKLIDGIIENLTITDDEDKEQSLTVIGDNDAVLIFPSGNNSIIEYDLKDVLLIKDNVWTLDFLYLETTIFVIPEKIDLIFVNDRPVYLDDMKGFSCHGCQMILEYSIDEPESLEKIDWEDKEFGVGIKSYSSIEKFNFDQHAKSITFDVSDENRFVTLVIPSELLAGPYSILLDDDEILFHEYNNNGTHVWVNMKPETSGEITILGTTVIPNTSGEITILGTTVIPEYLIIVLLAIGFLIILSILLVKKFNLH